MFISRSLGPKNRILGRLFFVEGCGLPPLMGLITMRLAFARRNRWKKPIRMPEVKRETSAMRDVTSAFMKFRR
jgi:hypothetical protein